MDFPQSSWYGTIQAELVTGRNLTALAVTDAVREMVAGRVNPCQAAAFLTALRCKGETAVEIAAAARVLREQMVRLVPVSGPVIDTCGTGGDSTGTFNISTAVAFVVSAAGVPVVKHGGRAVSSRSGSADVLRELGVIVERDPEWSQRCLDRFGFAFCYAPCFHGGMKNVAKFRQELGFRTLFNLIGPLANPASADYQLIGVGSETLLDPLAGAVAELGTQRTVLVCGKDGLDEVSLASPTNVRIVNGNEFEAVEWRPDDFGLERVALSEIKAEGPIESARFIRDVLDNREGPAKRIVLANTAAALWTAKVVRSLSEGVTRAEMALRSGAAKALLKNVAELQG